MRKIRRCRAKTISTFERKPSEMRNYYLVFRFFFVARIMANWTEGRTIAVPSGQLEQCVRWSGWDLCANARQWQRRCQHWQRHRKTMQLILIRYTFECMFLGSSPPPLRSPPPLWHPLSLSHARVRTARAPLVRPHSFSCRCEFTFWQT